MLCEHACLGIKVWQISIILLEPVISKNCIPCNQTDLSVLEAVFWSCFDCVHWEAAHPVYLPAPVTLVMLPIPELSTAEIPCWVPEHLKTSLSTV